MLIFSKDCQSHHSISLMIVNPNISAKPRNSFQNKHYYLLFYLAAVGTMKNLPAVSCAEILKSVGDVSGRYWLIDHALSSMPFMAYCNMTTLGKWQFKD